MSYQNPYPLPNRQPEVGRQPERVSPFQGFELGFPADPAREVVEANPISQQIGSAPLARQEQIQAPPLAGISRRAAAKIIDLLLTSSLYVVLVTILAAHMGWFGRTAVITLAVIIAFPAVWFTWFLYSILLIGRTLGKRLCRLEVITETGERLGPGLTFGRVLAETFSGALLGLGFLLALFDEQRRTLHDHLCGTRVVLRIPR